MLSVYELRPGMILSGRLPFPNGEMPCKDRFYIVAAVEDRKAYVWYCNSQKPWRQPGQYNNEFWYGTNEAPVPPFHKGGVLQLQNIRRLSGEDLGNLSIAYGGNTIPYSLLIDFKEAFIEGMVLGKWQITNPKRIPQEFQRMIDLVNSHRMDVEKEMLSTSKRMD